MRVRGEALEGRLALSNMRQLERLILEVRRRVIDGRLAEFNLPKKEARIKAALEKFESSLPPLWEMLGKCDVGHRIDAAKIFHDVLGSAIQVSSYVDHAKVPIWEADRRRRKAGATNSSKAAPRLQKLKAALPELAKNAGTEVAASEEFFGLCNPFFASFLSEADRKNNWPGRTTFIKVAGQWMKENRSPPK